MDRTFIQIKSKHNGFVLQRSLTNKAYKTGVSNALTIHPHQSPPKKFALKATTITGI